MRKVLGAMCVSLVLMGCSSFPDDYFETKPVNCVGEVSYTTGVAGKGYKTFKFDKYHREGFNESFRSKGFIGEKSWFSAKQIENLRCSSEL